MNDYDTIKSLKKIKQEIACLVIAVLVISVITLFVLGRFADNTSKWTTETLPKQFKLYEDYLLNLTSLVNETLFLISPPPIVTQRPTTRHT